MAPSREHDDAVGEASARDPIQLLKTKEQELARAEEKLREAQAGMDVDAEVLARQRIAVLKDQLGRLDAAAAIVRDGQGKQDAQQWLAEHHRTLGGVGEKIATVQAKARKLVEQLVAVITEEAALRAQVTDAQVRQEFLTLRWPELATGNGKAETLPKFEDYVSLIYPAYQDVLPRRGLRIGDLVPTQASDTPVVLRKKVLKTLAEFVTHPHNVKALGEVAAIIERAGIPAWETAAEKAQREAREAKHRNEGATIGGSMTGARN